MLTELCQELRNWFEFERRDGTFTISGGSLNADFLREGQYFRIVGSVFNDGVHQFPAWDLTDETFTGSVYGLAIPREVVQLAEDIDAWRAKYESIDNAAMSPFMSESFGGYSYQKGSALTSKNTSGSMGWQVFFASRLNKWRKI